ncbi:hypothetical protein AYI70_g8237 [Smittium culicis]|uniref:Uncharacterized protein n=1 Tax=Smittium culicis TaxID=133412 RepID=A0A1R1XGW8_9FUNG|nr:hypothetical protein AYI70_g8237 [Smittium culicis]
MAILKAGLNNDLPANIICIIIGLNTALTNQPQELEVSLANGNVVLLEPKAVSAALNSTNCRGNYNL